MEHGGRVRDAEPPAFPPFPVFEGGVVENSVDLFPCNWFQTYENQIDEVHVAFVHSPGGSHNALGRGIDLPDTSAEETPYGMVRHTSAKKGMVRATLYIFPNTMRIIIPAMSGLGDLGGWRDSYITLVPTDDEDHLLFMTQHAAITDEQMPQYEGVKARFEKLVAESKPPHEVAQDILDGKLTLADVLDHPKLLVIEDAVAQGGQGRIADRSIEHLGRTDVGIVRMRRVFDREAQSLKASR
jgi:5,5'-dehydrodivanillate O-demethylase